jgi:hypothetical protein
MPANETTLAVIVTDAPCTGLAGAALSRVADGAGSTCWTIGAEGLFANEPGSADVNTAVIECAPPVNVEITSWALPPASTGTGAPSDVAPSKNSTEPAGTPVAGATAETCAENLTAFVNTAGFNPLDTTVAVAPVVTDCTTGFEVLVV